MKEITFLFFILLLSCISENGSKNSSKRFEDKAGIIPCDTTFTSNLDTNFIDTLEFEEYLVEIKSISDSEFNELFCLYNKNTKTIDNPYVNVQFQFCPQIETKILSKYQNYASRYRDTLELKLEKGNLLLINTHHNEVNETYFYIGFQTILQSHIVLQEAEIGNFLVVPYKTGEKLYLGSDVYYCDSINQNIICDFSENVLDGGWFNNFNLIESNSQNAFKRIVSIDIPEDYNNNFKTWGIKNPFWITENHIVFSYYIGEMKSEKFYTKYCFATMKIIKKVSS